MVNKETQQRHTTEFKETPQGLRKHITGFRDTQQVYRNTQQV